MHFSAALIAAYIAVLALAKPLPGTENAPITDVEWQALKDGGLKARGSSNANEPITDAEWNALESGGLSKREDSPSELFRRDKTMNCGHLIKGNGGSNGHGKWVPVQQFADLADKFCQGYVGTDIYKNHQTSDTYGCTFSNGNSGNVVFAIYNTEHDGSWVVDHDTCLKAMQAPLGDHALTPSSEKLAKRDNCYGSGHNDYEGGYYKIDGIGAFGSEMYPSD